MTRKRWPAEPTSAWERGLIVLCDAMRAMPRMTRAGDMMTTNDKLTDLGVCAERVIERELVVLGDPGRAVPGGAATEVRPARVLTDQRGGR
jgi:hypothetical protein